MKKFVSKLIACSMIAGMLCSTAAFAADPITASKEDSVVTVTVSELGAKEETTLLVVAKDVTIEDAFNDTTKVYHIDQTAANDSGVATFTFTYTGSESLDVYSGYSSMSATDVPYETVLDLSGSAGGEGGDDDDDPVTPVTYTVGDVNNDGDIDGVDSGLIVQYFLNGAEFAFEYGSQAADVNYDTDIDGVDSGFIVQFFLNGAALPEAPAAE